MEDGRQSDASAGGATAAASPGGGGGGRYQASPAGAGPGAAGPSHSTTEHDTAGVLHLIRNSEVALAKQTMTIIDRYGDRGNLLDVIHMNLGRILNVDMFDEDEGPTGEEATCHDCGRNCITFNLLDLHISELHNPFFVPGKSEFKCVVDSCSGSYSTSADRRHHVMTAHGYPANAEELAVLDTTNNR